MPDDKQNYVYGLFRSDTGQIFYIGIGRRKRAWSHSRNRRKGRSHKDNIICKLLDELEYDEVPVVILRDCLPRQEAIDLEKALIYAIGRRPHGPLVNETAGGDGGMLDPSPALREKKRAAHRGKRPSLESRARMSASAKKSGAWRYRQAAAVEALRGKPKSKETRQKISASLTGRKQDPEVVARRNAAVSLAKKGKSTGPHTKEQKEKISQSLKKGYAEGRIKRRSGMQGKHHSQVSKAKSSASNKGQRRSAITRARMSTAKRGRLWTVAQYKARGLVLDG